MHSHHDGAVTNDERGQRMIPEVYQGFAQMSSAALAPGALDAKVEGLLAMVAHRNCCFPPG